MRTILALALVAGALGLPGAAHAAELTFAIEASGEYDSNVFRSSDDEKGDGVFRLRPWVQLGDERGQDLGYRLFYALPVEFAVEHSEVDDVDQELYGDVTYHVNDRFQVFASNSFRYLRSELRTNLDGTEGAGDAPSPFINDERDRVTLNSAAVGANYQFTPRLLGTAQVSHDYFDPSRDDRQENWQVQGVGSALYVVTPKLRLGGGSRIAYQKFYESQDIVGSNAQIYNVFGSARYAFDEKTEIAASVGPAVIRSNQDDADSSEVRNLVPFFTINGNFTAPVGFVDVFGNDVSGDPYPGGVVLVSQVTDCPELEGGQRVLVSDQSCNPSVVLDPNGGDLGLINAIEGATADVVNQDPDGEENTDVTVFADVVLTRHWMPNLHSALRYAREQGNASGLGGTVVGDSVTLSNTWDITEKWQFSTRGEWGIRKSVGEQGQINTLVFTANSLLALPNPPGAVAIAGLCCGPPDGTGTTGSSFVQRDDTTNIDTMRWGFASRVTRLFTRNTSGYVQFTYNQQESQSDSLGDPSDYEDYIVTLGVQHIFNPIKLW